MKRCQICNSTEIFDNDHNVGILGSKIQYWVQKDNYHICSKCDEEINNLLIDLNSADEEDNECIDINTDEANVFLS